VKDQYFGDRNDYFKYDLAISFFEQLTDIKHFTFIPMLTANDGGGDGGLIDYRQGAGRPDLYQFLRDKLKKRPRQVLHLREYFKDRFPFEYCRLSFLTLRRTITVRATCRISHMYFPYVKLFSPFSSAPPASLRLLRYDQ